MSEHSLQYAIHNYLEYKKIIHFETDVMSGLQYFSHNDGRRFAFINHHKKLGYLVGQPDLIVLKNGVYFVELKTSKGRQSKEQKELQKKLSTAGYNYLIWRSLDDCINFVNDS
jgi:hypothetical protein